MLRNNKGSLHTNKDVGSVSLMSFKNDLKIINNYLIKYLVASWIGMSDKNSPLLVNDLNPFTTGEPRNSKHNDSLQ